MREIKFRAWRPGSSNDMVYSDGNKVEITDTGISFYKLHYDHYDPLIGNATHVMQFTGLHDRLGKEIYEGDIVKAKDRLPFVIKELTWLHGSEYEESCYGYDFQGDDNENVEIIGNIYENSELVKPLATPIKRTSTSIASMPTA
jgi:hypothetical protein